MTENCKSCAFGIMDGPHYRYCRKRAPVVYLGVVGLSSIQIGYGPEYTSKEIIGPKTVWPRVEDNDFCGEFELKDA